MLWDVRGGLMVQMKTYIYLLFFLSPISAFRTLNLSLFLQIAKYEINVC